MTRLHVAPRPCNTCPYRTDTPPGIWHESEYRKLAAYDRGFSDGGPMAVFRCHQQTATGVPSVCVGWLGCHSYDSTAVRMALATGQLEPGDVEAAENCGVELYASGTEAAAAGLAGVADPDEDAQDRIAKLVRRGVER